MPTFRSIAAVTALTAAATAPVAVAQAAPVPGPRPATLTAPTGAFSPVRTPTFDAQVVTSPVAGRADVVGVRATPGQQGPVVVDTYSSGRWTSTTLAATAASVRAASAGGVTWILANGTTPSLWRSTPTGWVRAGLPVLPTGVSGTMSGLAVEGSTAVLWGTTSLGGDSRVTSATLSAGRWALNRRTDTSLAQSRASTSGLVASSQGHVLGEVSFAGGSPSGTIYDLTSSPLRALGYSMWRFPDASSYSSSRWLVTNPWDLTAWGTQNTWTSADRTRLAERGNCQRMITSIISPCPAPAWGVTAATRLADGRAVIGGRDTTSYVQRTSAGTTYGPVVPGGYAVVTGSGTPAALPGDPGSAVVDLAAEPTGTTVWSVAKVNGTTQVQRAVLPAPVGVRTVR